VSNFKGVVIYFLLSKPVVISPAIVVPRHKQKICKNNTTRDKFVVKATCVESTLFDSETSGPAFHPPSVGSQVSTG
jgi:hypothetical protein